ncbi:MAG: hypothetical protein QOK37_488 [Thermoanaerobaculia bacterium]|jgi:hypothetical protein|nr:hypothetical protein [Thermoanaerobaculia bacterium]
MTYSLGKVFISHSAPDKEFVRGLADRIEAEGFSPWLDERDLVVGDPLPQTIAEALRSARVVLVVISRASVASRWLRYELNIATDRMIKGECRVIPIVIENVPLPTEVQALLYANCRESLDQGWPSIITALQHEDHRATKELGFWAQATRLIEKVFAHGYTFSLAEYGGEDYNVVYVKARDHQGEELTIPYETIQSHGSEVTPLGEAWWNDYSGATERIGFPYSLIVTNRPLDIPLDRVHGATSRVGFKSSGDHGYEFGEHHVVFVDLSGVEDEGERKQTLKLARTFIRDAARERFPQPAD